MVRRRQKGDPPSPRLYKEGHYPPSCRDTRFTIPYHTIPYPRVLKFLNYYHLFERREEGKPGEPPFRGF